MTKQDIIEGLGLARHPLEGGYFRRTYESTIDIKTNHNNWKLLTSIYYLLTDDEPVGYLHKNTSDIIHYYHSGSPVRYHVISLDGEIKEHILGPNVLQGETPQLLVKGGEWKAAELCSGTYGLLSEAVSPGFNYEDNQIATTELISSTFPEHKLRLEKFIKPVTVQ